MTSALDSHFGLARQTSGKGTPITTDNLFKYFYFSGGPGVGPAPVNLPLDQEIGAGSLVRDVEKVGISTAGGINFIPRAETIGHLLYGALGDVSTATGATYNTHTFKFGSDEFDLPYYTFRRRLGAINGGEIASDVRVQSLTFAFQGMNFLRAQAGFLGTGAPSYESDISGWSPTSYLDTTPPFLTAKGAFELPDGTSLKALSGQIAIGTSMPLQEQAIVGSYTYDDAEITNRAIAMSVIVKADATLYEKMMYDADQTDGSWDTTIYREANIDMNFKSSRIISGAQNHQISFHFNGENYASGNANVVWTVQPINLQGNRQVLMRVTGMVIADTTSNSDGPFSVQLINEVASY